MNRKGWIGCIALVLLLACAPTASADPLTPYTLFEWTFNVDGVVYDSFSAPWPFLAPPPPADGGTWAFSTSISGAGAHNFHAFLDYEIDETLNGFSNEYG